MGVALGVAARRAVEAEVLAQGGAVIIGPEQATRLQFRDHQLDKIVEPAGQRLRAFPARSERRGDVAKQRTILYRRRICSSRVPDRDLRRVLSSGKGQQ